MKHKIKLHILRVLLFVFVIVLFQHSTFAIL